MWSATFGSGSNSVAHLLSPDYAAVRRRQGGTSQLEFGSEILLLIASRQTLHAVLMPLKIQMRKGFG
jgi:hypothetical protein